MGILHEWWEVMDDDDKAPWINAAHRLNTRNALGLTRRLSGRELFFREGAIDYVWHGGTYFALPLYIDFPTVAGLHMCAHTDRMQCWLNFGTWTKRVDLMIYGARSNSMSGWRRRQYTWLAATYVYDFSPATDITAEWAAKLGLMPEGEIYRIGVRWRKQSSVWSKMYEFEGRVDNSIPVGPA